MKLRVIRFDDYPRFGPKRLERASSISNLFDVIILENSLDRGIIDEQILAVTP